jgi:uncharacterized protein (DUF3820 family)
MTDQANVVPFGKYKGRDIEELLINDPAYLQWLASQNWFRTKFVTLHQIIINRGAEPEETPEHNALQVLFLNKEFCVRFVRRAYPAWQLIKIEDTSFEVRGADVEIRVLIRAKADDGSPLHWPESIRVEIKPTVSDDYPAVLRQMRRAETKVLFLEQYTGKGATREQFVQTFKTANIAVVFRDEVAGS